MDRVVLNSARKHGVTDDDMLYAYRNPVREFDVDGLTMLVGPDQSANLLEAGVAQAEGVDFIVHAMPACPRFMD